MQRKNIFEKVPSELLIQLFVDGILLISENGWLQYESREPNCIKKMFEAFSYALKHLADQATVDFICELHRLITTGVTGSLQVEAQKNPGCVRKTPMHFKLPSAWITPAGLSEFLVRERARAWPNQALKHNGMDYLKSAVSGHELYDILAADKNAGKGLDYFAPFDPGSSQLILDEMKRILDNYHQEIAHANANDDKLFVIVKHIQLLELLHPFPDANGRTFANVLLFYWLLQNHFLPVMLYETNIFDLYSIKEMVEMIKEGMYCTRALFEEPEKALFYDPTTTPEPDRKRLTEYADELKAQLSELDFSIAMSQDLPPYHGDYRFHLAVACHQVEKLEECGDIESFRRLMRVQCEPHCSPLLAGQYPIHLAIKLKRINIVLGLFQADPACLQLTDGEGHTALSAPGMHAIFSLIYQCVREAENAVVGQPDAQSVTRISFK